MAVGPTPCPQHAQSTACTVNSMQSHQQSQSTACTDNSMHSQQHAQSTAYQQPTNKFLALTHSGLEPGSKGIPNKLRYSPGGALVPNDCES